MKIGFDAKRAYHNNTGLGNYSRDLISILATHFPENEYYLYNTKPAKIDRFKGLSNIIECLPSHWFWKKLASIWRQAPIVEQIVKDKVEIYHGLSGEIPRNIHKKGIKTVVTIHDLIFVRYPELYKPIDRKIYFNKFKYAAKNADKIIAISEQTKRDIVDFLKVDKKKITVVYQGCHAVFKEAYTTKEKEAVRKKFELPDKYILNVGTIEERKNLLNIVKSITKIDVNLVVVGRKTDYFNRVEKYIHDHNLEDRIYFLEGVSMKELATLYQMADIFVYPSVFEGFGIPIIEALYSKTPVITTNSGVFPEAGGMHATYVEHNDVQQLEKEIVHLLSNEKLREEKIKESYQFVQKFNDEEIAKNLKKVYNSI